MWIQTAGQPYLLPPNKPPVWCLTNLSLPTCLWTRLFRGGLSRPRKSQLFLLRFSSRRKGAKPEKVQSFGPHPHCHRKKVTSSAFIPKITDCFSQHAIWLHQLSQYLRSKSSWKYFSEIINWVSTGCSCFHHWRQRSISPPTMASVDFIFHNPVLFRMCDTWQNVCVKDRKSLLR